MSVSASAGGSLAILRSALSLAPTLGLALSLKLTLL